MVRSFHTVTELHFCQRKTLFFFSTDIPSTQLERSTRRPCGLFWCCSASALLYTRFRNASVTLHSIQQRPISKSKIMPSLTFLKWLSATKTCTWNRSQKKRVSYAAFFVFKETRSAFLRIITYLIWSLAIRIRRFHRREWQSGVNRICSRLWSP